MKQDLFSERELRLAAAAADAAWQRALPTEDEGMPALSARLAQNMAGLLRRGRRQARRITFLRRTAAAVLALIAALSAWMAADGSARAAVVKWFRLEEENRVLYQFRESAALTELPEAALTWLPEGFELKEEINTQVRATRYFVNQETGEMILFDYALVMESGKILLWSENRPVPEKVTVWGKPAEFYNADDYSSQNNLIWFAFDDQVVLVVNSNLEKSVILHIAESIVLSEPTK